MQDRPLLGQVLARGQPRGVIARVDDLPLRPALNTAPTLIPMPTTALRAARPREFVAVRGQDAASYLQAMVSNDVESLAVGDACEALLSSPTRHE